MKRTFTVKAESPDSNIERVDIKVTITTTLLTKHEAERERNKIKDKINDALRDFFYQSQIKIS